MSPRICGVATLCRQQQLLTKKQGHSQWSHDLIEVYAKSWIFVSIFNQMFSQILKLSNQKYKFRRWSEHQHLEIFGGNWHLEAVEAIKVAEATEVNEAEEVSKAWKITTEEFRVVQVLESNNSRTYIILFWCFDKEFLSESCWILAPFLSEAIEVVWDQMIDQA